MVMEMCAPAAAAPIAKVETNKGKKSDNRLMENMEIELQRSEAMITRFNPKRVPKTPPMKENRRYPRRIPPLRSPIWL
jgi:hypothetical protein